MKIGILGGSFNPTHEGHVHISEIALKKLGLQQIWWLVSPQNPLKAAADMADFGERLRQARAITYSNPKIKVLDIEKKLGLRYTIDTVRRLQQKFPQYDFLWLMGADNLMQLPRWKKWQALVRLIPIHVFDRAEFLHRAVNSLAYKKYPGKIYYHKIRKNAESSTDIRHNRH